MTRLLALSTSPACPKQPSNCLPDDLTAPHQLTSRQLREHIVGKPLLPCPACGSGLLYVTSSADVVCLAANCRIAPWPVPRIAYEVDIVDGLARERIPDLLKFGPPIEVPGWGTWYEYLPAREKGRREYRRQGALWEPVSRVWW